MHKQKSEGGKEKKNTELALMEFLMRWIFETHEDTCWCESTAGKYTYLCKYMRLHFVYCQ